MCPPVEEGVNGHTAANGANGHAANGVNGTPNPEEYTAIQTRHNPHPHNQGPYRPVGDFLSNISNFKIIESTLREGEQFANAFFDTET